MKQFRYQKGTKKLPLPIFFPDATRGVVKTLDQVDVKNTKTPGVLVNTFHLLRDVGYKTIEKCGGIGKFMNYKGAIISDSGGFQAMSLAKKGEGKVKMTDEGVEFITPNKKSYMITPEESIKFQMALGTDLLVVLDDLRTSDESYESCQKGVKRTIDWAERCKKEFEKICSGNKLTGKTRPYLIGVSQGGYFKDLREKCVDALVKIGFDGIGYGGWVGSHSYSEMLEIAEVIAKRTPKNYFLYGLGLGKPDDIVKCVKMGYQIFDCVLPTRDARHKRLYVYNANSIDEIDVNGNNFYSYYVPDKAVNKNNSKPVSTACDCLLCKNYSRGYLYHLFKIGDMTAMRLASIHNLRFYSILMKKLEKK